MYKLHAKTRFKVGGGSASRLRNNGQIPVALHNKQQCTHLSIDKRIFNDMAQKNTLKNKIQLVYEKTSVPVIVREIQYSPVDHAPLHIDFQCLDQNKSIKVNVPIVLENVHYSSDNSTYLQHQLTELTIECLPDYIPSTVKADGGLLTAGHPLTVGDLSISDDKNIKVFNERKEVIALLARIGTGMSEPEEETTSDTSPPSSVAH